MQISSGALLVDSSSTLQKLLEGVACLGHISLTERMLSNTEAELSLGPWEKSRNADSSISDIIMVLQSSEAVLHCLIFSSELSWSLQIELLIMDIV